MQPLQQLRRFYSTYAVLFHFYGLLLWLYLMQYFFLHWETTKDWLAVNLPIWIASSSAWFLTFIGYESVSQGTNVIIQQGFAFQIVYHCAGVFGMIIFVSAVIAFPSSVTEKVLGILLGIPFLNLVNVLRISMLGVVGLYSKEVFDFCHYYLLQGVFIAFVIVTWMLWRVLIVKSTTGAVVPG